MASGPNVGANLLEAERLIGMAVDKGARLVVLPENFAIMGKEEGDKVAVREPDEGGPIQDFLALQAKRQGIWLVGGTVPLAAHDAAKIRAACLLYDDRGQRVARYDKIHLFDVVVVESDESYTESQTIESGDQAVVVDTPFGRLGLAVCYDLRFPELFRKLALAGAEIICLPAEWPKPRQEHWKTLLRARAIENQLFVIATNCCGVQGKLDFFGLSQLISPLGTVLQQAGETETELLALFDFSELEHYRAQINILGDQRADIYGTP